LNVEIKTGEGPRFFASSYAKASEDKSLRMTGKKMAEKIRTRLEGDF
jgi:hypothetical protein